MSIVVEERPRARYLNCFNSFFVQIPRLQRQDTHKDYRVQLRSTVCSGVAWHQTDLFLQRQDCGEWVNLWCTRSANNILVRLWGRWWWEGRWTVGASADSRTWPHNRQTWVRGGNFSATTKTESSGWKDISSNNNNLMDNTLWFIRKEFVIVSGVLDVAKRNWRKAVLLYHSLAV